MAALGAREAGAATDPPVITDIVVESFSTDDTISIRLPQTSMPLFTVRGSNFLPSGSTGPLVTLRREGEADRHFIGTQTTTWGSDAEGDWVSVHDMNLEGAAPGFFDVMITRHPTNPGEVTLEDGFEIKPHGPETLVSRGAWGGYVNEMQRDGNLIYLGSGRRLVILDATDEMNLVELGHIDLRGTVMDLEVRNGWAFVCTYGRYPNQFCVVDARDPSAPEMVWNSVGLPNRPGPSFNPISPREIELHGDYAYVMNSEFKFNVFDISNPAAPVMLGFFVPTTPDRFRISGDVLYTIGGSPDGLRLYDLSASTLNPPLLGTVILDTDLDDGNSPMLRSVDVEGDRALCVRVEGFQYSAVLIDVSNPGAPSIISTTSPTEGINWNSAALAPGLAFVAEEESPVWPLANDAFYRGLLIYDTATNPSAPALLATHKTHGSVADVRVIGDRAYVFDRGEGLIILDISNPAQPQRLGHYLSPAGPRMAAKNGELLYVSDEWNGFAVVDVSDPTHPRTIGEYQTPGTDKQDHRGIAYRDGLVYLCAGYGGLDVVDVSDPTNPVRIHNFFMLAPGAVYTLYDGLELDGNVAHVGVAYSASLGATPLRALWNLDISNPTSVSFLGELFLGTTPVTERIESAGGVTYLSGKASHPVYIVANADPTNPEILSTTDGNIRGFDLEDGAIYAAGEWPLNILHDEAIRVYDVSNPATPTPVSMYNPNRFRVNGEEANDGYFVSTVKRGHRLYGLALSGATYPTTGPGLFMLEQASPADAPRLTGRLHDEYIGDRWEAPIFVEEPFIYALYTDSGDNPPGFGHGVVIVERIEASGPLGDLNGDGAIGAADLALLLGAWGSCPAPPAACAADLDGDGSVGSADLAAMLGAWGQG